MSADLSNNNRRVIPRWRNLKSTILNRELNDCNNSIFDKPDLSRELLNQKISLFFNDETIVNAVEVINSAFVYKEKDKKTKSVAQFVINNNKSVSPSVLSIANEIINPNTRANEKQFEKLSFKSLKEKLWDNIRELKGKVRFYPYDAIAWIEMARYYLILGQIKKAMNAAEIALHLAPNNRYIVRSVSRLYIHEDDFDRAQHIIRNAEGFLEDPWLLGAEITISSLMNRSSRFIKKGHNLIKSQQFSPISISELCSSIATIEFDSGNLKSARKLFGISLVDPNDNSLAQASWMSNIMGNLDIDKSRLNVPNSFEAFAYIRTLERDFIAAYNNSLNWFLDQPFSRHPSIFGSYIAGTGMGEYKKAVELIDFGLKANPKNFLLLNNKTYYLICSNKISEAKESFNRIDKNNLSKYESAICNATEGFLLMAQEKIDLGIMKYNHSISIAKSLKNKLLTHKLRLYKTNAQLVYNKSALSYDIVYNEIECFRKNYNLDNDPVLENMINSLERILAKNFKKKQ